MDLRLDTQERGRWSIVGVGGEIDVATVPRLREYLITLIGSGRHHLVVDLEAVDFIDSTGLGVLIGALKRIRGHGGEMRLVFTDERVTRIFEITGLDGVFAISDSVDAALSS